MRRFVLFVTFLAVTTFSIIPSADAQSPVVRAVLFFSPTCPHCHTVMNEDLPRIFEEFSGLINVVYWPPVEGDVLEEWPDIIAFYGEKYELLYINIASPLGAELYLISEERFNIPNERIGVPRMVIGETVLVGALEIPETLPLLIQAGLDDNGIPWPDINGLDVALSLVPRPSEPTSGNNSQVLPEAEPSLIENYMIDPVGNSLAVIVLVGMVISIFITGFKFRTEPTLKPSRWKWWAIPLLSIGGVIVAGYLAYTDASGSLAVCGPIGDCNTVQQSSYAVILGSIHVSYIGLVGYLAIFVAWLVAHFNKDRISQWAQLSVLIMTTFGTVFLIYLTFLEPFVIGATCSWCLVSAIIITAQMLLAINPAATARSQLQKKGRKTRTRRRR
jgi:uncharacterized membrane protein